MDTLADLEAKKKALIDNANAEVAARQSNADRVNAAIAGKQGGYNTDADTTTKYDSVNSFTGYKTGVGDTNPQFTNPYVQSQQSTYSGALNALDSLFAGVSYRNREGETLFGKADAYSKLLGTNINGNQNDVLQRANIVLSRAGSHGEQQAEDVAWNHAYVPDNSYIGNTVKGASTDYSTANPYANMNAGVK